ncbi:MAG: PIG-L family deacetylase [Proteobacteria bacterium]|nr:PIG-L family deacetylase [Pseudomonadota bacterium]
MIELEIARPEERLAVLCIGAHSDDIEIGCGATLLGWIERGVKLDVHWVVLSAVGTRGDEARSSADAFLAGAERARVEIAEFRDGFFPWDGEKIKVWLEGLKMRTTPDVVLCHWRGDAHQDHRTVSELVWNTFRDHLVLEYEIPKWDGDLGRPNVYVAATRKAMARKVELLEAHFGTQRSKDWFAAETFLGLARLRGNECRAHEGFAEAFHARKLKLT